MCGLEIEVEQDRIVRIRGDGADPFSRGHICPKAPALAELHEDPDRLRRPVRRTRHGWSEISWDEALDEAAAGLHDVQERHGKDAVATYLGNPNVHNMGALLYGPEFLRTLGSRHRYSATSVDQLPHMMAAYFMFGHQLLLPIPDIDRTDFLLIFGANPFVSNGSIMSAPDVKARIRGISSRGGRVVTIDPRRTETARRADQHLFIKPGRDAHLLAGLLHVILEEDLGRPTELEERIRGQDELRKLFGAFSLQWCSQATGIAVDEIAGLARAFAAAPRAVCYGRLGVSTQAFGGLCQWMINLLNIVTGNFDRSGGAMFTEPAFDIIAGPAGLGAGRGSFDRWRSAVRELPEFGGELPVATLAEDILESPSTRIAALFTSAGNPVLSTPNGRKLEQALEKLEFMVSLDFYINETTRHADLVLPPTGPLEHDHYDVVFHTLAIRNTAKYSRALFPPAPHALHDWQIIAGLEQRLLRLRKASLPTRAKVRARHALTPRGILELGLRLGPYGAGKPLARGWSGLGVLKLLDQPHGVDLGPLRPCLVRRLPKRRDGETYIDLVPERFVGGLEGLRSSLSEENGEELLLIGRRQLRSNNSWMHNLPGLMSGKPRCTLLMHPDDARTRGVEAGREVEVRSRVGVVRVPVEISDEVMPGVVSLPHGFGHRRPGVRQSVAAAHPGASLNDLTDESVIDPLTGNAVLSGIPVEVQAVD